MINSKPNPESLLEKLAQSHLPSKNGMESLEKVSKARRSFPSLDPLRLCLCFLRKKDLRAAADSVFAALLSPLTSDMLSLLENSWSILQSQGSVVLARALGPSPARPNSRLLQWGSEDLLAPPPTHATEDPLVPLLWGHHKHQCWGSSQSRPVSTPR